MAMEWKPMNEDGAEVLEFGPYCAVTGNHGIWDAYSTDPKTGQRKGSEADKPAAKRAAEAAIRAMLGELVKDAGGYCSWDTPPALTWRIEKQPGGWDVRHVAAYDGHTLEIWSADRAGYYCWRVTSPDGGSQGSSAYLADNAKAEAERVLWLNYRPKAPAPEPIALQPGGVKAAMEWTPAPESCERCGGTGWLMNIFSQLCNHPPRPGQGISCPVCQGSGHAPPANPPAVMHVGQPGSGTCGCDPCSGFAGYCEARIEAVKASAAALLAQLDTANRDALAEVLAMDLAALEKMPYD